MSWHEMRAQKYWQQNSSQSKLCMYLNGIKLFLRSSSFSWMQQVVILFDPLSKGFVWSLQRCRLIEACLCLININHWKLIWITPVVCGFESTVLLSTTFEFHYGFCCGHRLHKIKPVTWAEWQDNSYPAQQCTGQKTCKVCSVQVVIPLITSVY